jgi:hypothetical protein
MIRLLKSVFKISFLFMVLGCIVPTCSFSQDSLRIERLIIIESTKFTGWQNPPTRVIFNKGEKVKIKKYNDTTIKGRIDTLLDSSIVIGGKQVKINEIKGINAVSNKGATITIIGLSTIVFSAGMMALSTIIYPEIYNDEDEDINRWSRFYYDLGFAMIGFVGAKLTLGGILILATVKHYRADRKWKLYVSAK